MGARPAAAGGVTGRDGAGRMAERRIAVIGAGLAGLACAHALVAAGARVVVHERSRGPGGRMATRRADGAAFDHGAQYFTVTDPGFAALVATAERDGLVREWRPRWPDDTRERTTIRVPVPGMTAWPKALAAPLDVRYESPVGALERDGAGWRLRDAQGVLSERFDAVVLAVPAPQALALAAAAPEATARLAGVAMSPCWAATVAFGTPVEAELDADWRPHAVLPWVARDRAKPGRSGPDAWVLHAGTEWSVAHLEDAPDAVAAALLDALPERLGVRVPAAVHLAAHRWRYARVETPLGEDALWLPRLGLGACGDWCIGARIEAAYLSGRALAQRIATEP